MCGNYFKDNTTIFGESGFTNIGVKIAKAQENYIFDEMTSELKILMPEVYIDRERLEKWVRFCLKLDNIEESDLITMVTRKKLLDLKREIKILDKALELSRKYMFNVMCADDVPSVDWFVKCADKEIESE